MSGSEDFVNVQRSTNVDFDTNEKKMMHDYPADNTNWRVLDCDKHCEEVVLTNQATLEVVLKETGPLHLVMKPGIHVTGKGGSMRCVITSPQ